MGLSEAIFAAGCFWGVQSAFDAVPGVVETEVGYVGGVIENPTYQMVSKGDTGYAEAVKVTFDNQKVSFPELVNVFFNIHDPTTKNRQGPDVGSQYRSAIFYIDEAQKAAAEKAVFDLNQSGMLKAPVVTEVVKAGTFYPAEEYHQKYFAKQGREPTCQLGRRPLVDLSEDEWQKRLTPDQYKVLRQKGTDMPFTGKYLDEKIDGTFTCAACGNPIFKSENKYDSGSGWPSFDRAIPGSVREIPDFSHGMNRVEVVCARCGSHLGHVFNDGPTETKERFCINSSALQVDSAKK